MRLRRTLAVTSTLIAFPAAGSGVVAAAAAPAAPAPQTAPVQKQTFTGGGSGFLEHFEGSPAKHDGTYTSSGQLGRGRFHFETSVPHGIARFTRSDGMTLTGTLDPAAECGTVPATAFCVSGDLTSTADIASAHVVLAVQDRITSHAIFGDTAFLMRGTLTLRSRIGYVMVDRAATTFGFGGIDHLGDAHTIGAIDVETTPTGAAYWTVNAIGQVFAFGEGAPFLGGVGPTALRADETVTTMSATPTGRGYWLFTSRGRVFTFGDATAFGDLAAVALNRSIVGSAATPTGRGYYMVGADGGVFAFGDAAFRGSMGNVRLNQPVVGIVANAGNTGYWLVASDGGVFSFGARFLGSMGGVRLNQPVVAIARYGTGYLLVARDGGVFNFASRPFYGSLGGAVPRHDVVNGSAVG